jgi:hypothetical protein
MEITGSRKPTPNEQLYLEKLAKARIARARRTIFVFLIPAVPFGVFAVAFIPRGDLFLIIGLCFLAASAGIFCVVAVVVFRLHLSPDPDRALVTISGAYHFKIIRTSRSRRTVYYIGEQSVFLPHHWRKLLTVGQTVTAEAYASPAFQRGGGWLGAVDPAFEAVSLDGRYSVDKEVPLGLLKLKGTPASLGIACVLGLFVVMFSVPLVDLRVAPWESVITLTSRLNAAGSSAEGTERAIERPVSAAEFFSLVFSACFLATLPFPAHGLFILFRDRAIVAGIRQSWLSAG